MVVLQRINGEIHLGHEIRNPGSQMVMTARFHIGIQWAEVGPQKHFFAAGFVHSTDLTQIGWRQKNKSSKGKRDNNPPPKKWDPSKI